MKQIKKIKSTPSTPSTFGVVDSLNSTSTTDSLSANMGRVLNEKISNSIGYIYNSGQDSISFTPPYDCFLDLMCVDVCWGYGGRACGLYMNCTQGGAELLYGNQINMQGGDLLSRSLTVTYGFKCLAGVEYTFTSSVSNFGGRTSKFHKGIYYRIN